MATTAEGLERITASASGGAPVVAPRRWFAWPPSMPQALTLVLLLCVISGLIGWRLAQPSDPGAGSVDVGFLTDMQTHHQQALELGYEVPPLLRTP